MINIKYVTIEFIYFLKIPNRENPLSGKLDLNLNLFDDASLSLAKSNSVELIPTLASNKIHHAHKFLRHFLK
jgi:hypothetical protein